VTTSDDVDLVVVTMIFDAADVQRLQALLAKYVVITRGHPGCRNVDLLVSATKPNRHLVVQKWEGVEAQRAHFDSPAMVELAEGCRGILTGPPDIDLFDSISAHDLH
jgi:quinol monooxygenase YgiN